MAPHYQATTLIASPSYPNAITWSSENLVAVASAHIVTILNPADHDGPRGLVVLHPSNPFPIGVVSKEDLFEPCLVPTGLARDTVMLNQVHDQFHGLNNDLLIILAVCSGDVRLNLYGPPIREFDDNWVNLMLIGRLMTDGRLNAHVKCDLIGNLAGAENISSDMSLITSKGCATFLNTRPQRTTTIGMTIFVYQHHTLEGKTLEE